MAQLTESDLQQNAAIQKLMSELIELRAWRDEYRSRMAKDQVIARLEALEKKLAKVAEALRF